MMASLKPEEDECTAFLFRWSCFLWASPKLRRPAPRTSGKGNAFGRGILVWKTIANYVTVSEAKVDLPNPWLAINSPRLSSCASYVREQGKRCPHLWQTRI